MIRAFAHHLAAVGRGAFTSRVGLFGRIKECLTGALPVDSVSVVVRHVLIGHNLDV